MHVSEQLRGRIGVAGVRIYGRWTLHQDFGNDVDAPDLGTYAYPTHLLQGNH